ncbi:heterokaryon incompatibility protein-domain-containing protein [Zalerion maritima]|uniref:Heterokaryon incompatibility protein-domain-containing protein n=1 Tax=Zalerion maritima TaxID=339359 RepID=A0AAD5WQL6_9PEZI|nr:heterokaryon incompatibility protein-domain-containing protein [Zalerion maritima]
MTSNMSDRGTATYTHYPLSTPQSIRVLILQPAPCSYTPLRCSIDELPLNIFSKLGRHVSPEDILSEISYEALSYVWGERTGSLPLEVITPKKDNYLEDEIKTLLITPSCDAALRHLRYRFKPRRLWVDAICIDQISVEEKNFQVPLMGTIFKTASTVLIWLGKGAWGDWAVRLAVKWHRALKPSRDWTVTVGQKFMARLFPVFLWLFLPLSRMNELGNHDWHQRVWTLQELGLASTERCYWGGWTCSVYDLYSLMRDVSQGGTYLGKPGQKILDAGPAIWRDHAARSIRSLTSPRAGPLLPRGLKIAGSAVKTTRDYWRIPNVQVATTSKTQGIGFDPLDFIIRVQFSSSTDPRDMVYGITGILQLHNPSFNTIVYYDKPVDWVYTQFVYEFVLITGRLDILQLVNPRDDKPSWLFDWTLPPRIESYTPDNVESATKELLFPGLDATAQSIMSQSSSASIEKLAEEHLDGNTDVIYAKGFLVSTVSRVSSTESQSCSRYEQPLTNAQRICNELQSIHYWCAESRAYWPEGKSKSMVRNPYSGTINLLTEEISYLFRDYSRDGEAQRVVGEDEDSQNQPKDFLAGRGGWVSNNTRAQRRIDRNENPPNWAQKLPDLYELARQASPLIEMTMELCCRIFGGTQPPRIHSRRFFSTDSWWLGNTVFDVQEGDLVFLLEGCGAPVILRPEEDGLGCANGVSRYRFLGACYVYAENSEDRESSDLLGPVMDGTCWKTCVEEGTPMQYLNIV